MKITTVIFACVAIIGVVLLLYSPAVGVLLSLIGFGGGAISEKRRNVPKSDETKKLDEKVERNADKDRNPDDKSLVDTLNDLDV